METGTVVLLMAACLCMEAFFSGSEIGVVSADRLKLRHQAAKGSRGARMALAMLQKPEWLLSTTLVGTNIAIVTNASLGTMLAVRLLGVENSWMAVLGLVPIIWIFGEIVPKSVFQQQADWLTPRIIYVLKFASYLFWPILLIFTGVVKGLTILVGGQGDETPFTLKEEIDMMLQMQGASGDIHPVEKGMIRRIFQFGQGRVRDIMVPLVDVDALDAEMTCGPAIAIAARHSHRRLMVYSGRVDNMIGMINAIDLINMDDNTPVKPFIKPIRFVPGSQRLEDLLVSFRENGDNLAVVIGEFGGCHGVVTLRDTLERVVGEIQGEFDSDSGDKSVSWVRQVGEQDFLVSGRIDLATIEEKIGISLPDGNYETLAGFLLEKMERIPAEDESYTCAGALFTVEKATPKVIHEILIQKQSKDQNGSKDESGNAGENAGESASENVSESANVSENK
ncbi:MAG: HlyC/CorC family transporter [Magnetococcales bacterium]|nr:HlyC/CorC family transporter [Magnetococcales bacterium]